MIPTLSQTYICQTLSPIFSNVLSCQTQLINCLVLDGAIIVHLLPTATMSTFNEYAGKMFIPYLNKQLEKVRRIDLVGDTVFARLDATLV